MQEIFVLYIQIQDTKLRSYYASIVYGNSEHHNIQEEITSYLF